MNQVVIKIIEKFFRNSGEASSGKRLAGSELTSILLEVFDQYCKGIHPSHLMKFFAENRFVQPGLLDPIETKRLEIDWLEVAKENGFTPITLSPVAPLGSCSSIATVSQKKVLSSIRGTEVLADATNVLVLQISKDFSVAPDKHTLIQYATTHRHVRAQQFDNPDYTAHFDVFCMASGGLERGNFDMEIQQLEKHITTILKLLKQYAANEDIYVKFSLKEENEKFRSAVRRLASTLSDIHTDFVDDFSNRYYQLVQFKVYVKVSGSDVDFADGGLVDWSQKLTGNKKHRAVISGIGLELVQKLLVKKN